LWTCALAATVTTVAAGASPPPADTELAAFFPRPGAVVVTRAAGDFGSDGAPGLAAVLRLTDGAWRLMVLTLDAAGAWALAPGNVKVLDVTGEPKLEVRDVTGDRRPELLVRGPHGLAGFYGLFNLRDGRLVTLLSLLHEAERPPLEIDLGGGAMAVVERGGETGLYPGGPALADEQLTAWCFDGQRFVPMVWQASGQPAADDHLPRLAQLAAAHLWSACLAECRAQQAAADGPATRANVALAGCWLKLAQDQAARLEAEPGAAARLAAGVAWVLAGDYGRAADDLLGAAAEPKALPADWQTPLTRVARVVEVAAPELAHDAGLAVVRGFVALAAGNEAAARTYFKRAAAIDPQRTGLTPWMRVGAPVARLWFLDAEGGLNVIDLAADARPVGERSKRPEWGPARAIAARGRALALVNSDGDALWYSADGRQMRRLLSGEFLWLSPGALAPDGSGLAVDEGSAAVRKLRLVDLPGGRQTGSVVYAGASRWAPDSRRLVLETTHAVTPPLPWEDGGTRDLTIIDRVGQVLRHLASGDATRLWVLEEWPAAGAILATRQTLTISAEGEARVAAQQRYAFDPDTGQRRATTTGTAAERLARAVRRRLPPKSGGELVATGEQGLLVWRAGNDRETTLYAAVGDGPAQDLGSAAGLNRPFVAALGQPEEEP
jgi:tetratricopeptide (TPR) repeat protein